MEWLGGALHDLFVRVSEKSVVQDSRNREATERLLELLANPLVQSTLNLRGGWRLPGKQSYSLEEAILADMRFDAARQYGEKNRETDRLGNWSGLDFLLLRLGMFRGIAVNPPYRTFGGAERVRKGMIQAAEILRHHARALDYPMYSISSRTRDLMVSPILMDLWNGGPLALIRFWEKMGLLDEFWRAYPTDRKFWSSGKTLPEVVDELRALQRAGD